MIRFDDHDIDYTPGEEEGPVYDCLYCAALTTHVCSTCKDPFCEGCLNEDEQCPDCRPEDLPASGVRWQPSP